MFAWLETFWWWLNSCMCMFSLCLSPFVTLEAETEKLNELVASCDNRILIGLARLPGLDTRLLGVHRIESEVRPLKNAYTTQSYVIMTYNPSNAFPRVQLVLDPRCSGGLLLESTLLELKFQKHGCLRLKKHNNRISTKKRTAERTTHQNSGDRDAPITAVENQLITAEHSAFSKVLRKQSTSSPDEDRLQL